MTAPIPVYLHRGPADGHLRAMHGGGAVAEVAIRQETTNGSNVVPYRRTDYFRDVPLLDGGVVPARIYMPAVMVGTDGKVNP